ncbi:MAG: hypothetical protein FJ293_00665 [Planctomycetes bacterium]|nr:hypothetical protein [Planctomycetota bacterium]
MASRNRLALLPWLCVAVAPAPAQESGAADAQDAAAPAAAAPAVAGYEHSVPGNVLLYAGVDSFDQLLADLAASAYGRLLQDEAAKPVRDAFARFLESLAAASKEESGFDFVDATRRIDGRIGWSLSGDLDRVQDTEMVVALESSEHAAELHALAMAAVNTHVERGDAIFKSEAIGTREVVQLTPMDSADKGRFRMGVVGSTMALGIATGAAVDGDQYMRFVQALDGEGGESLAMRHDFAQSLAARAGGVKFWLDTGRAVREQMTPPAADGAESPDTRLTRALGLDQLGALSARLQLDASEMRLDAQQTWTPVGLAKVLTAFLSGGEHALLTLVPAEAATAISLRLDLPAGLDAAEALAKEAGLGSLFGEPAAEGAAPGAEAEEFHPRRDLLDHLDGRLALSVVEVPEDESLMGIGMQGGPSVNTAFILGVRDATALAASLDRMLRKQGMHAARRKSEFEGYVVYSLPLGILTVNYAIVDDFMVVSPSPTLLQDVLRRKSNRELPSLRTSPAFMASFDALAAAPALAVWSSTTSDVMEGLRGAMLGEGIDPAYVEGDEEGGAFGGEPGGDEADPVGALEPDERGSSGGNLESHAMAMIDAFSALDPKLLLKYLPAGQLLALRCDQAGAHFEIVAR